MTLFPTSVIWLDFNSLLNITAELFSILMEAVTLLPNHTKPMHTAAITSKDRLALLCAHGIHLE